MRVIGAAGAAGAAGETTHLLSEAAPSAPAVAGVASGERRHEIRILTTASLLTTVFFFIELFGGYVAGSLAVMSDAAHLLSDLAGFVISLLALCIATMPANAFMSFGFARAEVLGAFVSILCIWILTAALVVCACYRILFPEAVDGPLMLLLGIIGLAVNFLLGFVLSASQSSHTHLHDHGDGGCPGHGDHGEGHSHVGGHSHENGHGRSDGHSHGDEHSHEDVHSQSDMRKHNHENGHSHRDGHGHRDGHSHGDGHNHSHGDGHNHSHGDRENHGDVEAALLPSASLPAETPAMYSWAWMKATVSSVLTGASIESLNVRAAYLHALGDALQSIGVIFAAIILTVKPSWTWVDPLCTLFFACMVMLTTKGIATDAFGVLMEGTPPKLSLNEVYEALMGIANVKSIGDLHVWSITAGRPALSAHVFVSVSECTGRVTHDIVKTAEALLLERFGIDHVTIQVNCDETECCADSKRGNDKNCVSTSLLQVMGGQGH